MMERVVSGVGLISMLVCAWLLSTDRRRISWRVVIGGTLLQFGFALLILRTDTGRAIFVWVGRIFRSLIDHTQAGSQFVFGINPLPGDQALPPSVSLLRTFAFGVLPTIIFFSSLMSVLYHLGLMQRIVSGIARVMQWTLRTSAAESLSAAANIFVGQTEAPLVVRPYVAKMTLSELNAVMVGGYATIAGGVLAAYVQMGINAGHLVTASVISAPAALTVAKLMVPETETPATLGKVRVAVQRESVNLVEAAASGATDGMKLAANVGAMLIAFLALLSLANGLLGWMGERWYEVTTSGIDPMPVRWSIEGVLGFLLAPFAWLMGIPWEDCHRAGGLLGVKTVANEFVAYDQLVRWRSESGNGGPDPRTVVILTYALSGFANFGSIGIQIGGISAIAPGRRSDLARLGLRAMIGGTLAAYMTACVAGILY